MQAGDLGKPFALLSLTDKTGILDFAKQLVAFGYEILSTGGTAAALTEAGIPVTEVRAYTGSGEIMDGRVKTLHPKIHAGILFDRASPSHVADAHKLGIRPIDLVCVNLYQFAEKAVAQKMGLAEAIAHIDIGGPTMIRAAAKNWRHVTVVTCPNDYDKITTQLALGPLADDLKQTLAGKAFALTASYDTMIANYFTQSDLSAPIDLSLQQVSELRYGENPHQKALFYRPASHAPEGLAAAQVLQGKPLSYNNILDLDAAWQIAQEFSEPAIAIVKHTNPCGVASGAPTLRDCYTQALACDPQSAFGGIIATNRELDGETATAIAKVFTECIAAPSFSTEALAALKGKENLRLLQIPMTSNPALRLRSVLGGVLLQDPDHAPINAHNGQVVTKSLPTAEQLQDMTFAMRVCRHVKSNAIVLVRSGRTIGIGAGQMSRIDAARLAADKAAAAGLETAGAVLASDAFFPFADTVQFAHKLGIKAIIQPGGSKRDHDSVQACDQSGIAMVMTGQRHFRH